METNINIDFNALTTEDICTLINNTLSGDNAKIAEATKLLKAYTKHKSSIRIAFINEFRNPHIDFGEFQQCSTQANGYCAFEKEYCQFVHGLRRER